MDFNENLALRYNALTKQGKRVADYVRQNPAEAVTMTAKALGDASGTSAAAVVRLCQQLGYTSLEQMKISLAKSLGDEDLTAPIDPIITGGESVADVAQKLFHNHSNALKSTLENLNYDDVKQAVQLMQKANRVYLFGVGSSGLVAAELCHRLNRVGKTCIFLQDAHTGLAYAPVTDKKDVVICFSYSGETKEVYLAAQNAQSHGVPVIAVTRTRPNTLRTFAGITLPVPDTEKRVRVGAVASKVSQMFIVDVLYMCMVQKDFAEYENMLVESSRLANRLRE